MPADSATFRTNGLSDVKFLDCQDAGPDCRPATLPAEEQNRIHEWIQEGAQYN